MIPLPLTPAPVLTWRLDPQWNSLRAGWVCPVWQLFIEPVWVSNYLLSASSMSIVRLGALQTFNPHKNPVRLNLLSPFCPRANGGSERLCAVYKVTQLAESGLKLRWNPKPLHFNTLLCLSLLQRSLAHHIITGIPLINRVGDGSVCDGKCLKGRVREL